MNLNYTKIFLDWKISTFLKSCRNQQLKNNHLIIFKRDRTCYLSYALKLTKQIPILNKKFKHKFLMDSSMRKECIFTLSKFVKQSNLCMIVAICTMIFNFQTFFTIRKLKKLKFQILHDPSKFRKTNLFKNTHYRQMINHWLQRSLTLGV